MIKILIVDDDKLARKGLISIMPWEAHDMAVVGEAANGMKALEFLEKNQVDLMFVDLSMPVMSGIDLLKKARELYPDLRFVIVTFHEDFEYIQTALRLGAIDYVSKIEFEKYESKDFDDFLERIRQTIKQQMIEYGKAAKLSGENAAVRDTVEKGWKDLYWLFNDTAFDNLCVKTAKSGLPASEIERVFTQTVTRVESVLRLVLNPWPIIPTVEWMKQYREKIYQSAQQAIDMGDTSICVIKAVFYIRNNLESPLHADFVSSQVGMSRSYFCQCFKKLAGLTYNDYIRQERIAKAKRLLPKSQKSVKFIAGAVGYEDEKYFSRIFREETGVLPSEYRNKSQK